MLNSTEMPSLCDALGLECRASNIAWHAGNETQLFVERTAAKFVKSRRIQT